MTFRYGPWHDPPGMKELENTRVSSLSFSKTKGDRCFIESSWLYWHLIGYDTSSTLTTSLHISYCCLSCCRPCSTILPAKKKS